MPFAGVRGIRTLIRVEEEVRAGTLPPRSGVVIEAVLFRGELPRGDVGALLGTRQRQARRVTSVLLEREILVSESSRAPLWLAFPARLAPRWMPGLFPEAAWTRLPTRVQYELPTWTDCPGSTGA